MPSAWFEKSPDIRDNSRKTIISGRSVSRAGNQSARHKLPRNTFERNRRPLKDRKTLELPELFRRSPLTAGTTGLWKSISIAAHLPWRTGPTLNDASAPEQSVRKTRRYVAIVLITPGGRLLVYRLERTRIPRSGPRPRLVSPRSPDESGAVCEREGR